VGPLRIENLLKALDIHVFVFIYQFPLRKLLILFKLLIPLLFAPRRHDSVRLPVDHRKATFSQSGVAAKDNDPEY
jgi:hypothetical protein